MGDDFGYSNIGSFGDEISTTNLDTLAREDKMLTNYHTMPTCSPAPIFLEGGLYHFIVRIATVDYDRTMLPDNNQPLFDGYLSVGNVENYIAAKDGIEIPFKITSY